MGASARPLQLQGRTGGNNAHEKRQTALVFHARTRPKHPFRFGHLRCIHPTLSVPDLAEGHGPGHARPDLDLQDDRYRGSPCRRPGSEANRTVAVSPRRTQIEAGAPTIEHMSGRRTSPQTPSPPRPPTIMVRALLVGAPVHRSVDRAMEAAPRPRVRILQGCMHSAAPRFSPHSNPKAETAGRKS